MNRPRPRSRTGTHVLRNRVQLCISARDAAAPRPRLAAAGHGPRGAHGPTGTAQPPARHDPLIRIPFPILLGCAELGGGARAESGYIQLYYTADMFLFTGFRVTA